MTSITQFMRRRCNQYGDNSGVEHSASITVDTEFGDLIFYEAQNEDLMDYVL